MNSLRFFAAAIFMVILGIALRPLLPDDEMVSEQIPVPNQDPEVVTVIEYSNLVKDCEWKDPCEFVPADEFMQRVKWLMDSHQLKVGLLNSYREDDTCSMN